MQIRCSHILQKHKGSRNPKDSYRNKIITRSLEQAKENIKAILEQVKNNSIKFNQLAFEYSQCGSAAKKGDLGLFGKGAMQKPFEQVAFKLQVGEISGLVETQSGVHIIMRTQ